MNRVVLEDVLVSLHEAGAIAVPPWMAVTVAAALARPDGIGATIDWLVAHRAELEAAYAGGIGAPLGPGVVAPELRYTPEIGGLDRARDDHRLRDKWLFAEVAGRGSFTQAAVYAITGVEVSAAEAAMLDEYGTINLNIDPRVWPLAVTRRVAGRGGGYMPAVVAGLSMMGSRYLAGVPAGECARLLRRARAAEAEGVPVEVFLDGILAAGERFGGFGRPVVGPDERVAVTKGILARYGRDGLPYASLLGRIEDHLLARKGLRSNSAAWCAAILGDLGIGPDGVVAIGNYWVTVCVYAQALYSMERGEVAPSGG